MTTFDDVFDEVVSKTKSVTDKIGQKTGDFIDATKLRFEKSDIEREINLTYEGIGRLVYDSEKSGDDVAELIEGCIEKLNDKHAQLEEVKRKIDEFKSVLRCRNCGTGNARDAVFCNRCGHSLKDN